MDTPTEPIHNQNDVRVTKKIPPWWRRPAGIFLIVFLSLGCLVFVGGLALFISIIRGAESGIAYKDQLTEEWIGGRGKKKVARISISGVIVERTRTPFNDGAVTADRVIEELRMASEDDQVAAVILRVDSPGGGVTASDRIHREVEKLREKKKVVVLMGDMAASGGYYVSAAAHKIFAHPTTVTGSIGVVVSSINLHDLMEQFGVHHVTIKSGKYKDMLSPFKPVEEISDDKALYQQVVMTMYERFVSLVSRGRGIPIDRVRELADGRIYDAKGALANGLIDEIGYQDDVLAWLKKKLGKKHLKLIEYTRPLGFFSRILLEGSNRVPPRTTLSDALTWLDLGSRPLYLWLPGI